MKDLLKKVKKLGLDFHGIIDIYPKIFSFISEDIIKRGWEVHIITGSMWTVEIEKRLKNFNIQWIHHFSVTDDLLKKKECVKWIDSSNPWFDKEKWNRAKAEYCKKENITLHIDDSDVYGEFFQTPYLHIKNFSLLMDENIASTFFYHIRRS